jgi:para-nitrobenzyl esterase
MIRSLVAAALLAAAPATAETVHLKQGDVSGVAQKQSTAYLGLPFAAPPVGDLRWKAPQPAPSWNGVRQADHFGADCRQGLNPDGLGPWTPEYMPKGPVSEDCLYLNVWRPAKPSKARLPVMVWVHGGAFTGGSGAVPIYNGAALAQKGIIVVTINYRVGVYGFLAHPDLTAEAGTSGNYGLMDQIAALKWVHDNIAAFGGDPDQVTVAGQSAGAASVHDLLMAPDAKGLFRRAIAESGSGIGSFLAPRVTAEKSGRGLGSIADLRRLDPEALEAAVAKAGAHFAPIVDGKVIPAETAINPVPILTGITANETSSAGFFSPDTLTPDGFKAMVTHTYGPLAPQMLKLYPPGKSDDEAKASRDALARDSGLAAMDLWAEKRLSGHGGAVYGYLWTHVEPGPESGRYKAFHSSEIPYVFGTLDAAPRPFTDVDRKLSAQMTTWWANWVKSGDPDGKAGLWRPFSLATHNITVIGDTTVARPILPPETLELFKAHVANGGKVSIF